MIRSFDEAGLGLRQRFGHLGGSRGSFILPGPENAYRAPRRNDLRRINYWRWRRAQNQSLGVLKRRFVAARNRIENLPPVIDYSRCFLSSR
jgi:hypothetical protein